LASEAKILEGVMWEAVFVFLVIGLLTYQYLGLRKLAHKTQQAIIDSAPFTFTEDHWALLRDGASGLLRFVLLELFLRGKVLFKQKPSEVFSLPEANLDEPLRAAVIQKTAGKILTKKDFKPLLNAYPIQHNIEQKAKNLIEAGLLRAPSNQKKLKASSQFFFILFGFALLVTWFFLPQQFFFVLIPGVVISFMVLSLRPFGRYVRTSAGAAVLEQQREAAYGKYQSFRETGQLPADTSALLLLALFGFSALAFYQSAADAVWEFAIEFSESGSDGDNCSSGDGDGGGDGGGGGD
jgi:uncharacterized protein (TIGR04222 family)